MRPAKRAFRIAFDFHFVPSNRECVKDKKAPDKRLANLTNPFDGFIGLHEPDNTGYNTNDAGLGARRHFTRWRKFAEDATIARAAGTEDAQLSLKLVHPAKDKRFLQKE